MVLPCTQGLSAAYECVGCWKSASSLRAGIVDALRHNPLGTSDLFPERRGYLEPIYEEIFDSEFLPCVSRDHRRKMDDGAGGILSLPCAQGLSRMLAPGYKQGVSSLQTGAIGRIDTM